MRRRDPVKRGIWIGSFLVFLVLLYAGSLYMNISAAKSELARQQKQWDSLAARYKTANDNISASGAVEKKLNSLVRVSTNRFLWGSTFNALQQTVIENVQVVRLHTDQSFLPIEALPAQKDGTGKVIRAAKPPQALEKVSLLIDGKDWNPAEQNIFKFRTAIANFPYFQAHLAKNEGVKLNNMSTPSRDPADPTKQWQDFTLELRFPDTVRDE